MTPTSDPVTSRRETRETDPRNVELLASRMAKLDEREGPRVGDYVRFACGTLRRCSYHWTDGDGWDGGMQTSDGGSFHLGEYGVSFSGSLFSTVPTESLTLTDERLAGRVWIEHHGWLVKDCAVHYMPEFRVYACTKEAPR